MLSSQLISGNFKLRELNLTFITLRDMRDILNRNVLHGEILRINVVNGGVYFKSFAL
jgi:hypothetical protein